MKQRLLLWRMMQVGCFLTKGRANLCNLVIFSSGGDHLCL